MITTEIEYEKALERVHTLMENDPDRNSPEGDELDYLAELIIAYEETFYPTTCDDN